MSFLGKHVVITGGVGAIGLAMATEFVDQGAAVTLLDMRNPNEIRDLIADLRAEYRQVDVRDPDAVGEVVDRLAPIDVAIGNAGVYLGSSVLEISAADWRMQIDVNLTGIFFFAQAAARKMVKLGRPGAILFTGSWAQEIPGLKGAAYGTSKAAVRMLARCMALELGPLGIRVNVVAPGMVNAGMAKRQIQLDPEFARKAEKGIPLGKLQTAEQVAKASVFLCSDAAEAITGVTLLVDGGASLFKYE
jgi:NAD(P)-dependent dehydrogenase (short-subunit alcohol dehydrogenase family)